MKFGFIIMGDFTYPQDCAAIHGGEARMVGVANLDEACTAAQTLCSEGVACIELCGAFGPDGARAVARATHGAVPVGYVTHLPEQDALYRATFG